MPAASRSNKKASAIAFNVLGIPANLKDKKSPFQKKIDIETNKLDKTGYNSK